VVEVLLAPGDVVASRLDVAARVVADPDVRPRRRDHQVFDSGQRLGITNGRALLVLVAEAATAADTPDPGIGAVDASQAWHG
jgi:hypothetical protein